MIVNARLVYFTLRWVGIMFLMPIGYLAVLMNYHGWFRGQSQIWKLTFVRTTGLTLVMGILSFAWFTAALALTFYFVMSRLHWNRKLEDNIPEDDPLIVRTYQELPV